MFQPVVASDATGSPLPVLDVKALAADCQWHHRYGRVEAALKTYNPPMPELPEVERVRLSLVDHLVGRRVVAVTVRRAEVVELGNCDAASGLETALLRGMTIQALERHGKQLAIIAGRAGAPVERCRAICVHLGMTGSLVHRPALDGWHGQAAALGGVPVESAQGDSPRSNRPERRPARAIHADAAATKHTHLTWRLDTGGHLLFDDPRRFGGVWTFARFADLRGQRWSALGEDALLIAGERLHEQLQTTKRGLKAALLDQSIVAGLGNIYVDELLFERRLHPLMPARRAKLNDVHALVDAMRALLHRAIASGGSSLRDYVDGNGNAGAFQLSHQVYGRGGELCGRCGAKLRSAVIAGRTTVWCPACQKRR